MNSFRFFLIFILALLGAFAPCCGQDLAWQRHTGVHPDVDLGHKPEVLWKYTEAGKSFAAIVAYKGIVMGLDRQGSIHALDNRTGKRLWKQDGFQFTFGYGLELTRDPGFDVLLVGCDIGVSALDRKTGKLVWENRMAMGADGPTFADDLVLAAGSDGNVYGLDLKTGKTRWKHEYLSDRPDDPKGFDGENARFSGRPARPQSASTDGKNVYFSVFDQCRTIAVDLKTGKRSWSTNTQGWMRSRPVIGESRVFVGSQDSYLYSLSRETGKVLWKFKTGSRVSAAGAIGKNNYFFGSNDGFVYAVDLDMGNPRWKFKTEPVDGKNALYSQCQLVGDDLLVSTLYGNLYLLDSKTGKKKWQMQPVPKSVLSCDPQIDGEIILLSSRKRDTVNGESCIIALSH